MKGYNQNKSGGRKSGGTGRRPSKASARGFFGGSVRGSSRESGKRSFHGAGRQSSRRPTMHEVTCDKCGEKCEVPFRPTGGKPVYCSNCFRKGENSESRGGASQFKKEFDQINKKLDMILQSLSAD